MAVGVVGWSRRSVLVVTLFMVLLADWHFGWWRKLPETRTRSRDRRVVVP